MGLLHKVRLLIVLLLVALPAAAQAQAPEPSGRWAIRADGRVLVLLDLVRAPGGGWTGSLTRPAELLLTPRGAFAGVGGPVETRRIVTAAQRGPQLELGVECRGGGTTVYRLRPLDADTAELRLEERGPALLLSRAAPGETVAGGWDARRVYTPEGSWPSNPEMTAIFEADQAARRNPVETDWDLVRRDDEARRVRTRALLDAGELRSGEDFYHAAFVFQHGGAPDHYLLAHVLAMAAMQRGHAEAGWIAAATLDRYLQTIGRPQVFGTQYRSVPGEPTTQEPYDRALFGDPLRSVLGVPGQDEQEERRREFETQQREREQRLQPRMPSPHSR
jgi:hypothetical protein